MLTELEQRIMDAIRFHISEQGCSPTLVEIGEAVGVTSKGTLHRYVQGLIEKGQLVRNHAGWRGLQLVDDAAEEESLSLPLLGEIAAGLPIEAIPGHDRVNLADFFMGPDRFILKVVGDSMIDVGILDGDMVVIRHAQQAYSGDIVVALIDGNEATLKRLKHTNDGRVKLLPENSTMEPFTYAAHRVRIQGVLVGQMRSYI
ncbi:MAG: transcriptional repressor LexA [Thiotrichaceae bacterium]|nr:transcriptional repressor LexA [Thiotrichaceae bacterium]PCI13488.1 MAG: repressor LexA [Thiotrichales bacterium]